MSTTGFFFFGQYAASGRLPAVSPLRRSRATFLPLLPRTRRRRVDRQGPPAVSVVLVRERSYRLEGRQGRALADEAVAERDPLQVNQELAAARVLDRVEDTGETVVAELHLVARRERGAEDVLRNEAVREAATGPIQFPGYGSCRKPVAGRFRRK